VLSVNDLFIRFWGNYDGRTTLGHGSVATELNLASYPQSCMVQVLLDFYMSGINHETMNLKLENDQYALLVSKGYKHWMVWIVTKFPANTFHSLVIHLGNRAVATSNQGCTKIFNCCFLKYQESVVWPYKHVQLDILQLTCSKHPIMYSWNTSLWKRHIIAPVAWWQQRPDHFHNHAQSYCINMAPQGNSNLPSNWYTEKLKL
jgi:hypothetical protein